MGLFSHKKSTIGHKYYLGIHMVLCHGPVDKITKIAVGEKQVWSGSNTGGGIYIDKESIFGGKKKEGGIKGTVDIDMGLDSQLQNTYLVDQLGADIPAFRGVVSAVLRQVYLGTSQYIKLWNFRTQRIHTPTVGGVQWNDSKSQIGVDMNPAHIIRECLLSNTWGMGYLSSDIDDTSFTSAASTLYSEGMGISIIWDKQTAIEDFIQEIVKHIDGSLYVDRTSGKFKLKLVRDDYDSNTILKLDESNITKLKNYTRPILGELTTSVTVIYWSQDTGKNESVTAQDVALARTQDVTINTTAQYPGFTNGNTAAKVASRDLKALSTPLVSCKVHTNREAYSLNIGDAFKLSWPDYGVSEIVMRVTQIAFGGINNNEIVIDAVQDVFSASNAIVGAPPGSEWVDPIHDPSPCPYRRIKPVLYYDLVKALGTTYTDLLGEDDCGFAIFASESSPDAIQASINVLGTYGYEDVGELDFCPVAILSDDIGYTDTVLSVSSMSRLLSISIGTYLYIDDEIMKVNYVDSTSVNVGRGCLDTVPTTHSSGSVLFFSGEYSSTDGESYGIGASTSVRLTTITENGELDIDSAPTDTLTHKRRQSLPYNGQNLQLNGEAYPEIVNGYDNGGKLYVSWSHRDRLTQIYDYFDDTTHGDIGPEAGTTYTAQLLTGSTVLATHSGLVGTLAIFQVAEIAGHENLRVKLKSVRDSLDSYQEHDYSFTFIHPSFDSTTDFTMDEEGGFTTFDME